MAKRRALGGTGIAESRGRIVALLILAVAVCGGGSVGYLDELFEGDSCQLESGTAGVCRRANNCGWLPGALRRRTEKIVNCGFDHEVAIVCCPSETVPVKLSSTEVAVRMCENSGDGLDFHILSGKKAANGEVPFIAALGYKVEDPEPGQPRYKWSCGSSLISPSFLLTAAHCVQMVSPVVARMGTLNLLNDADKDLQDRQVKNIIVHPDYKRQKHDDIALIEVDNGFGYDELVKPVCLGTSVKDMDSTRLLLAAGWGVNEKGMTTPDMLFIANLTIVPNDECQKQFESLDIKTGIRSKHKIGIRDSQYCAIGEQLNEQERVDTCMGDSGGPLYYTVNNKGVQKYVQVGVTSFGVNCGSSLPSVYTRVAYYLDWIVSHVWPEMAASA